MNPDLDPEIPGQNSYAPRKSETAIDQVRSDRARYGDGDLVTVSLFKERIYLGKMTIPEALLGAAPTHGVKPGFQLSKANGILGLGFPTDPANASRRNLVQTLYDLGKVKHASFALIGPRVDPKLAEKIDNKTIMQPRGTFVIGSVDPAYYTGSIAWCPQIVSTNRWIVKLDRILINGVVAFENQMALIDTGTAYIVASPANFDKTQTFIDGAAPIDQKGGLMFSFPSENLQNVGFVFGSRQLKLQRQDFGLGGIKRQGGKMCSSIVRLREWGFQDNLWVLGGIFLDNMVTIFDYGERKVGFADIPTPDVNPPAATDSAPNVPPPSSTAAAATAVGGTTAAAAGEGGAPKDSSGASALLASDVSTLTIPTDVNPPGGREYSQLITFSQAPFPQIASGFHSLDLGSQHIRAITFADCISRDAFQLHLNANADTDTHGTPGANPNSDAVLRAGTAAWLRTMPDDPFVQVGRYSVGKAYDGSWSAKGLPESNSTPIAFPRKFEGTKPPKVIVWLSGMDFSKAYNWRLQVSAANVTPEGFALRVGPWGDSVCYKADVTWIAHADVDAIQSGTFSTEDVRGQGWQLETSGVKKFERPFGDNKVPRFVCGLNKIEFGCGRDLKVQTTTEMGKEGFIWSMNSEGNTHQYITAASWIAFDPVGAFPRSSSLAMVRDYPLI